MLRDHMYWQNCKYTDKKNNNKQIIKFNIANITYI